MFVDEKRLGETQAPVTEVGRILLDAADYIERHGWCQRVLREEDGRVCTLGAISRSCEVLKKDYIAAYAQLYIHLNYRNIGEWNDTPGRTREEVVRTLREAAYVR